METLRNELIETQKVRSDLMKWKLIIVAGIGGAALGLSGGEASPSNAHFALAIIPIACVYVDLLCRHLSLRNKAIGLFIRTSNHDNTVLRNYEHFYREVSRTAWAGISLESVALVGCTVFLSLAIIPVGILASGLPLCPVPTYWPANLFIGSGACGIVLSWAVQIRYSAAKSKAEELSAADCGTAAVSLQTPKPSLDTDTPQNGTPAS